jgi:hypothetical protein
VATAVTVQLPVVKPIDCDVHEGQYAVPALSVVFEGSDLVTPSFVKVTWQLILAVVLQIDASSRGELFWPGL